MIGAEQIRGIVKYDYDLTVIGGGAAGLTAAGIAANLGVRTLLVESRRLGGDCTWYGCVPSKALIRVAGIAHTIRTSERFCIASTAPRIDLPGVMDHIRAVRQEIYLAADHPDIYRDMGIEVVKAEASFVDSHSIMIKGDTERMVTSRYVIIATGSRPRVPSIDGLKQTGFLTNESLFEIESAPSRLAVLGAGPVGIEMAQAFQRLGSSVTVIDRSERILGHDDPEHASILLEILRSEGIDFRLSSCVESVRRADDGVRLAIRVGDDPQPVEVEADSILVATGRVPNIESLNLAAAGIRCNDDGIIVDEGCRTSRRNVYACGDVAGRYQFTHMAEHMAKIATSRALLKLPLDIDSKAVPWCTFTDPNVAHVGTSEKDLRSRGKSFEIYCFPYSRLDRAITDRNEPGQIKVFATRWSGRILGVEIIGAHAGDLISEYAVAMRNGISLRKIADTIHPYPTYGLGNRRAADQWYARLQSAWLVKLIKLIFGYRGRVPDLTDKDRIV